MFCLACGPSLLAVNELGEVTVNMTGKSHNRFTGSGSVRRASLALTVSVAAIALACASVASAAPTGADHRPSAWATSADAETAGPPPSLTGEVDEPTTGTSGQLVVGFSLLWIGGLGLLVGLAARHRRPRRSAGALGADGGGWRSAPTAPAARP